MTNPDLTLIGVLVDRSGSMQRSPDPCSSRSKHLAPSWFRRLSSTGVGPGHGAVSAHADWAGGRG
jgi:hypothetical protein